MVLNCPDRSKKKRKKENEGRREKNENVHEVRMCVNYFSKPMQRFFLCSNVCVEMCLKAKTLKNVKHACMYTFCIGGFSSLPLTLHVKFSSVLLCFIKIPVLLIGTEIQKCTISRKQCVANLIHVMHNSFK